MEFVAEPETRIKMDPAIKFSVQAQKLIQDSGVILRSLPGDIIGFCPPLIITDQELCQMFDMIESAMPAIDALAKNLQK